MLGCALVFFRGIGEHPNAAVHASPVVGRLSSANVSAFGVDKDSTNSLTLKRNSTVGSTSRRGEYTQTVRYEEMSGEKNVRRV